MNSQLLSPRECESLQRVGDMIPPAHGDLPAFSESSCADHIDELLDYSGLGSAEARSGVHEAIAYRFKCAPGNPTTPEN